MTKTADNILPIRQSQQQKQIVALIKKFHHFADIVPDYILRDFKANEFDEWAYNTSISEGEQIISQFILGLWDRYSEWKVGPFDFFYAANRLGKYEWKVITEWCQNPFFP